MAGISWVVISIHDFGAMNYFAAIFVTAMFVGYLSIFPLITSLVFYILRRNSVFNILLFACLWTISEILRAKLFTGFPWLLAGTSQLNTPIHYLAPIFGVYGLTLTTCICAGVLAFACTKKSPGNLIAASVFVLIIILPLCLENLSWTKKEGSAIKVAIIQADLSMRDKWDETKLRKIMDFYFEYTTLYSLHNDIIILPETAIPLPTYYIKDYLQSLNAISKKNNSALVLGVIYSQDAKRYYNALQVLGTGQGQYCKTHLVPFGEYIPDIFKKILTFLGVPQANLNPGFKKQHKPNIKGREVSALICFELAYPNLLRNQFLGDYLITISDNGWFGHSLASYQHQQIAQMLSLQTGKYQIVANNNGLSAIISEKGLIIKQLKPFSAGVLEGKIFRYIGITPWIKYGDIPVLTICLMFLLLSLCLKLSSIFHKKFCSYCR